MNRLFSSATKFPTLYFLHRIHFLNTTRLLGTVQNAQFRKCKWIPVVPVPSVIPEESTMVHENTNHWRCSRVRGGAGKGDVAPGHDHRLHRQWQQTDWKITSLHWNENKLIYLIIKRSRINKKLTPYCVWIEMSKHIHGPTRLFVLPIGSPGSGM